MLTFYYYPFDFFCGYSLALTSTGPCWFMVELRLRRWDHSLTSHRTDWESEESNPGYLGTSGLSTTPRRDPFKCGSRGGDRGSGPPPGKSQVIWVSIGNKQLDPPPPGKSWTPPPWKMLDPSGTLKNDIFY